MVYNNPFYGINTTCVYTFAYCLTRHAFCGFNQEVTKRCRLSGLTNSALAASYMSPNGGDGGGGGVVPGSQPMSTAVRMEPK